MKPDQEPGTVQALSRALDLLEVLAATPRPLPLKEISERAGLNRATAYRLLTTLAGRGYVEPGEAAGTYGLGVMLFQLGSKYTRSRGLTVQARKYLNELAAISGETVNLGVLVRTTQVVYIDKVESQEFVKMDLPIGKTVPSHCTALGKAIMAFRPPNEISEAFSRIRMERMSRNSVGTVEDLLADLNLIRQRGYALDLGELHDAINCVAVPIFGPYEPIASLSVAGPSERMTPERLTRLAPFVLEAGKKLSLELGYMG